MPGVPSFDDLREKVRRDDATQLERTCGSMSACILSPPRRFVESYLLLAAVKHRSMSILRYLIEKRHVPVNCTGRVSKGYYDMLCGSPLSGACWYGKYDAVVYLEDHQADVNRKNEIGESPLHIASKKGRFKIVRYLGNRQGVDINYRNSIVMATTSICCRWGLPLGVTWTS